MEIKPAMVAIAAFIVVVVLGAVLMPVLDDATTTEDKFTNEGYFKVSTYDISSSDTLLIKWDHTAPNQMTVNGEVVALPTATDSVTYTVVGTSDNTLLRYQNNPSSTVMQAYGGANWSCSTTNGYDMTFSITGSTATITSTQNVNSPTTLTLTGTVYYANVTGDYVMKKSNVSAYLNGDSDVYGIGTSVISGTGGKVTKLSGSIDDGFTGAVVYPTSGYTSGDVTATYSQVSDHLDLYSLEKCTWVVTDSNSVETTITYSYFIVPSEVTAERSVHLSANENAILLVIPALVIIAILIGILAVAFRMRE